LVELIIIAVQCDWYSPPIFSWKRSPQYIAGWTSAILYLSSDV